MNLIGDYRHEMKYAIALSDYYALRQRIRTVMKPDPHVRANGLYRVRSIYFDNVDDKALREKEAGIQVREKFRIRYYNDDLSFISLEKKIKHNDLCLKVDCPISEKECRDLLDGRLGWMAGHAQPLVQELFCKMQYQQLRPRVLVSYIREPYVYAPGHIRVTFDSNIRSTLFHGKFLEDTVQDIAVNDGQMILEAKYTGYMPEIITEMLQLGSIRLGSYSKYGACRRFG